MAEQLLLRKGLYADLAAAEITPGAISITTDEPGIYIDIAEYNTDGTVKEGTKERVRIGDFITFPSLQVLYDATNKNYPVGTTPVYSEHALYYAERENVLCKYVPEVNGAAAHFVWINDTTALQNDITQNAADITSIDNKLGEATTGNSATAGKTAFQAIEDEYARALDAEGKLEELIKGLKDDSDGTVGDLESVVAILRGEFDQEVIDRGAADTILQNNIDSLADAISALGEAIGDSDDAATDETVYGAIAAEKARAEGKEGELQSQITDLTKTGGVIAGINQAIGDLQQADVSINNTISGINDRLEEAEGDIDDLETTVGKVSDSASNTGSLYARIAAEIAARADADSTLQGNINTLSGTVNSNKTTLENAISTEAQTRAAADTQIRTDFAAADSELEATLKEYVNDHLAAADAMTFKGVVQYKTGDIKELDMPLENVQCGDTYVVSANIEDAEHAYHAGDLIIAKYDIDYYNENGTTDAEKYPHRIKVTVTENGVSVDKYYYKYSYQSNQFSNGWEHVKTGYDQNLNDRLKVKNATIKLESHAGSDLGQVKIASTSTNIEVTTTAATNTTPAIISFNLVWGAF